MIWWIFTSLALLAVLIIVLLLLPYRIRLTGLRDGEGTFLTLQLGVWNLRFFRKRLGPDAAGGAGKRQAPDIKAMRDFTSRLLGARGQILHLTGRVMSSVNLVFLRIHLKLGLGDAADTAMINGYLWSIGAITGGSGKIEITSEPDFFHDDVTGSIDVEVEVRPFIPAVTFIWLLGKRPFREFLSGLRNPGK